MDLSDFLIYWSYLAECKQNKVYLFINTLRLISVDVFKNRSDDVTNSVCSAASAL